MNDPLTQYLQQVANCAYQNDRLQLSQLLTVDPRVNPFVVRLYNYPIEDKSLNNLVDNQHFFNDEWLAFNELVISFVRLCKDLNPWSALESYDLYTTFINDLSIAFNNNSRGHFLTSLVKSTIAVVLPMTVKLDFQLYYKDDCLQPRLTYLASVLLKMFNNIRSQLTSNDKKSIILFIGYKLCYIYFKLDNPLLCQNIFSNMNNASLQFELFNMNEQIQYRYYLAKFYFIKNQLADAYLHFNWCLKIVSVTPGLLFHNNIALILKYLVPISILMGKRPNFHMIQQTYYPQGQPPEFLSVYSNLYDCIRKGDYSSFVAIINQPAVSKLLKRDNFLIVFGQKSLILLVRNLIKRVWIFLGKPIRLDYETIKNALNVTIQSTSNNISMFTFLQQPIVDLTVENILITLVDQNLLKGKLFLNQRAIALAKVNVFPPVDSIYFVRFGNGLEDKLNHNDKWMIS